MLMNFFNNLFSRSDINIPITMNSAIQYYILRNNVKELKKYSSTDIINQKYFMSQYPIVIIMLKKVISNVSEMSDYTSSGSAREWKAYAVHIDKILLTICYLKRVKTGVIKTNTNTVKYDDEQIFTSSEVSCFVSVFDHIVQVKEQEKMILKEIEVNNKISSLRNNLCS